MLTTVLHSLLVQSEDLYFYARNDSGYLTVCLVLFVSLVIQANYGKEEKSQNQRKLGTAENPHPGCAQKRCKLYSLGILVINRFLTCKSKLAPVK